MTHLDLESDTMKLFIQFLSNHDAILKKYSQITITRLRVSTLNLVSKMTLIILINVWFFTIMTSRLKVHAGRRVKHFKTDGLIENIETLHEGIISAISTSKDTSPRSSKSVVVLIVFALLVAIGQTTFYVCYVG